MVIGGHKIYIIIHSVLAENDLYIFQTMLFCITIMLALELLYDITVFIYMFK